MAKPKFSPEIILRGIFRSLFAAAIAIFFLLTLMIAAEQQHAIELLKAKDSNISYSVARKLVSEANAAKQNRAALKIEARNVRASSRSLEKERTELESDLADQARKIDAFVKRMRNRANCEVLVADTASLPADGDRTKALRVWPDIKSCVAEKDAPQSVIDEVIALQNSPSDPIKLNRQLALLEQEEKRLLVDSKNNDSDLEQLNTTISQARLSADALQGVEFLENGPFVGSLGLASIPPALMHIILCFLSGLFGALMLTLILAVYPNNEFNFTTSDSYWGRILLGGLIAVGVFVVAGGGVAVLGSGENILNGDANFMSFCAIGMLAGMFSDRVAQWLSKSANVFLAERGKQAAG